MATELGRSGGKAFVKKYGKKRMNELAKRGAKARWANKGKKTDDL